MRFAVQSNVFWWFWGPQNEPFGSFWSPSGPRPPDGFGIPGSRSDEIGNSINSATISFCAHKKNRSHMRLFFVYTKNTSGPSEIINYPDRGPELGSSIWWILPFGWGCPTRRLGLWKNSGPEMGSDAPKWSKIPKYRKWPKVFERHCRFYCKTNGKRTFLTKKSPWNAQNYHKALIKPV